MSAQRSKKQRTRDTHVSSDEEVDDASDAPPISLLSSHLPEKHLRSHVSGRPSLADARARSSESKIGENEASFVGDEPVGGFDITMAVSVRVKAGDGVDHGCSKVEDFGLGWLHSTVDPFVEVAAGSHALRRKTST